MKSDAKILENTRTCDVGTSTVLDVPLSDVPLSFRARVQAFSKKCGFFSVLRCTLIELAAEESRVGSDCGAWSVPDSVQRRKISDYSKKA